MIEEYMIVEGGALGLGFRRETPLCEIHSKKNSPGNDPEILRARICSRCVLKTLNP